MTHESGREPVVIPEVLERIPPTFEPSGALLVKLIVDINQSQHSR